MSAKTTFGLPPRVTTSLSAMKLGLCVLVICFLALLPGGAAAGETVRLRIVLSACGKPGKIPLGGTLEVMNDLETVLERKMTSRELEINLATNTEYQVRYLSPTTNAQFKSVRLPHNAALVLCVQVMDPTTIPLQLIENQSVIDRLREGESFQVQRSFLGCFSGFDEKWTIIRKGGLYLASFQSGKGSKDACSPSTRTLSVRDRRLLREFEQTLNRVKTEATGSCGFDGTEDSYIIRFRGQQTGITNPCSQDLERLLRVLRSWFGCRED